MTGAAGLPLLHLSHGVSFALGASGKNLVVTIIALVKPDMERVAEIDFTGIRQIKRDIFYADMTPIPATSDTEGNICVMTGTAGAVFLHLPHGVSATPFAPGKYSAVTVCTDIHLFCRVSMNCMAETCRHFRETDIRCALMAFLAIPSYRKSFS